MAYVKITSVVLKKYICLKPHLSTIKSESQKIIRARGRSIFWWDPSSLILSLSLSLSFFGLYLRQKEVPWPGIESELQL